MPRPEAPGTPGGRPGRPGQTACCDALAQPESPLDRQHVVRLGYGAGVEPQLHAIFEERFGFPLVELWGMTEMVRVLSDHVPPRKVGTRAFGKAMPGLDVMCPTKSARPRCWPA